MPTGAGVLSVSAPVEMSNLTGVPRTLALPVARKGPFTEPAEIVAVRSSIVCAWPLASR